MRSSGEPPSIRTTAVNVELIDEQAVAVDAARLQTVAAATAGAEGAFGYISITLVDTGEMARLNREHMGKTGPTDVLAFPIDGLVSVPIGEDGPDPMIGDLILCPEVAQRQAAGGFDAELDLLVAHGVLHLLGYDHDTPEGAERMRAREYELVGRSGAQA